MGLKSSLRSIQAWRTRSDLALGGAGIVYLLRDEFITDLPAGSVDGTAAEPGPGTRGTVENDGTISIAAGLLNISGQATVTYGDLGIYWTPNFARESGLAVEFRVRRNGLGICAGFGWMSGTALSLAQRAHCFQLNGTAVDLRSDPNANVVATTSNLTFYKFKIVLKATGCNYYFNDALVGSGTASVTTPLWICLTDGDMQVDVDYVRVWRGHAIV